MTAQKADGGPAYDRPTVLARPENLSEPRAAAVNVPPQRLHTFKTGSFQTHSRRWSHRPSTTAVLSDLFWTTLVVLLYVLIATSIIAAICVSLWIVTP